MCSNERYGRNGRRSHDGLYGSAAGFDGCRVLFSADSAPEEEGEGKKKDASKKKLKDIYFYVTGNNLLTFTGFSGDDPELVEMDGYYRGYGQPLSRSVIVGLKLNF